MWRFPRAVALGAVSVSLGACGAPAGQAEPQLALPSAPSAGAQAGPAGSGDTRVSEQMAVVDALVVKTTIWHSVHSDPLDRLPHHITELHHGSLVRMDRGEVGIVPAMILMWDFEQAKGWMLSRETGRAAPLDMDIRDVTPADRRTVATELGLPLDASGGLLVPEPPLEPVNAPPPSVLPPGAQQGSAFRIRDARKDHEVVLWVAQGLPLGARDYANTWRRRMPPPWTAAEQRLLDAFEALPGFPIEVRIDRNGWHVVHQITSAKRESRPASLFEIHAAEGASASQFFIDQHLAASSSRRVEGRVRLGLDKRFQPSSAQPLPPALPGGHCKTKAHPSSCIEAWDGVETLFSENCDDGTFNFNTPCPRNGLRGICESADRSTLRYDYAAGSSTGSTSKPPIATAPCDGRWFSPTP